MTPLHIKGQIQNAQSNMTDPQDTGGRLAQCVGAQAPLAGQSYHPTLLSHPSMYCGCYYKVKGLAMTGYLNYLF